MTVGEIAKCINEASAMKNMLHRTIAATQSTAPILAPHGLLVMMEAQDNRYDFPLQNIWVQIQRQGEELIIEPFLIQVRRHLLRYLGHLVQMPSGAVLWKVLQTLEPDFFFHRVVKLDLETFAPVSKFPISNQGQSRKASG